MQDDQLVLTLRLEPDGACYARRLDLSNELAQFRLAFRKPAELRDIFNQPADAVIRDLVRQASGRIGVLLKPDFHFRIGSLVLSAARVLLTSASDGAEQIMIRFGKYTGDLSCLFRAHVLTLVPRSSGTKDDVIMRTMEEFVLPVVNFGHYLDEALQNLETQNVGRMRRILSNVRDRITVLETTYSRMVRSLSQRKAIAVIETEREQQPEEARRISGSAR